MRKFTMICFLLLIVSLFVLAGCGDDSGRKLVSKPVVATPVQTAQQSAVPTVPASEPAADSAAADTGSASVPVEEEIVVASAPAGKASCNQLTTTDLTAFSGGTWTPTSDCPKYPMMPKGVSVCQCSFDGPKQLYVNLETQLYDSGAEALRVFNMYCSATDGKVGDKSCTLKATSANTPNFVYFLKGNYFVKVSCLGGSCPLESIGTLATKVDAKI
jgi:hypothetical protein